jgi:hypothetical protein
MPLGLKVHSVVEDAYDFGRPSWRVLERNSRGGWVGGGSYLMQGSFRFFVRRLGSFLRERALRLDELPQGPVSFADRDGLAYRRPGAWSE